MQTVMQKAQELAEAIVDSQVYQRMHTAEMQVTRDEEAARAISDFMEKRNNVQNILASAEMNHDELAAAGKAMEEAEKVMNDCAIVKEMQESRREFSQMMENVNRILRLVITGETEDEGCSGDCGSCGGDCGSCGGCH